MRTTAAHRRWLLVSSALIGLFGPVFALGASAATDALPRWTLDLLAWTLDGQQTYGSSSMRFLSALTGGFLLGWGVMILALRAWAFDRAPDAVRRSLVVGACAWFVLDSCGSAVSGHPSNVAFNVLVLLAVVGPMWLPAQDAVDRLRPPVDGGHDEVRA